MKRCLSVAIGIIERDGVSIWWSVLEILRLKGQPRVAWGRAPAPPQDPCNNGLLSAVSAVGLEVDRAYSAQAHCWNPFFSEITLGSYNSFQQ